MSSDVRGSSINERASADSALINSKYSTIKPSGLSESVSTPLKILHYTSADTFSLLKDSWQALEKIDETCTPFNTWQWNALWWKYYGVKQSLALLVALSGRRVVAIAPFYIHQTYMCKCLPVRVLRFVGSGMDTSPDYLNIVADPKWRQSAEAMLFEFLPNVPGWQKAYFSDVSMHSSLDNTIQSFLAAQHGSAVPRHQKVLYRSTLPKTFSDYLQSLTRRRRKKINHRKNRLAQAGHCELNICANTEELQQASNALVKLHRLRWQQKKPSGAFVSDEYEQFHREIIRQFFNNDSLWLITLKLNNEIVGVQYAFYWRGSLMFVQSGYSPLHLKLSPGHVLFTYAIERAIDCGLVRIDMLKGDYKYKTVYAKDESYTVDQGFIKPGFRALANSAYRQFAAYWTAAKSK